MIESMIVIFLIGLIFFGILQTSLVFTAREVLHHAAARGARAKTVGFNRWMCRKAVRVATIPISGNRLTPENETQSVPLSSMADTPGEMWDAAMVAQPSSADVDLEKARIPYYLGTENLPRSRHVLDYEGWHEGFGIDIPHYPTEAAPLEVTVEQTVPLEIPMHRVIYGGDKVRLIGRSRMETHYSLYLEDQDW
jgi:hypothetical protein